MGNLLKHAWALCPCLHYVVGMDACPGPSNIVFSSSVELLQEYCITGIVYLPLPSEKHQIDSILASTMSNLKMHFPKKRETEQSCSLPWAPDYNRVWERYYAGSLTLVA